MSTLDELNIYVFDLVYHALKKLLYYLLTDSYCRSVMEWYSWRPCLNHCLISVASKMWVGELFSFWTLYTKRNLLDFFFLLFFFLFQFFLFSWTIKWFYMGLRNIKIGILIPRWSILYKSNWINSVEKATSLNLVEAVLSVSSQDGSPLKIDGNPETFRLSW